jgi:hypothetical protein
MHPVAMSFDHSSLNGFILNAWPCPVLGSFSCEFHTIKHAIIRRIITIPGFTENRCRVWHIAGKWGCCQIGVKEARITALLNGI